MKTSLEQHLADFLKNIKTAEYRKSLLKHWDVVYGDQIVAKALQLEQPKRRAK